MMRKTQRRLLGVVVMMLVSGILNSGVSAMRPVYYWSSTNEQPPHWDSMLRTAI